MRIQKDLLTMTVLLGTMLAVNAQQNDLPTIPYGRLVKASLINTVESGAAAPVIGVVSQDVWFGGKIIIPAHSEIHGLSQPQAIRDRIACNNQFIILFGNGEQLRVQGMVLDRDDANADKYVYGPTDGSYGMKGEIIKNAFVRVPSGHHFYLYVQTAQPKA
jgi:hypothetical protein